MELYKSALLATWHRELQQQPIIARERHMGAVCRTMCSSHLHSKSLFNCLKDSECANTRKTNSIV